jgi:hypothetical protein
MKRLAVAPILLAASTAAFADQAALDGCIASWGSRSPFKKGTKQEVTLASGVKVFGVGSAQTGNDPPTAKPQLILVRPAVNVMGKTTIKLSNPNGWYCFRSNVTVAGALHIDAPCTAQIASAREDGTTVGAADESGRGVAVFGALRVNRYGCPEGKK